MMFFLVNDVVVVLDATSKVVDGYTPPAHAAAAAAIALMRLLDVLMRITSGTEGPANSASSDVS